MAPSTRRTRRDDHRVEPPTPQPETGTLSKTRLANIPKQVLEKACKYLKKHVSSDEDDDEILDALKYVYLDVHDALKLDPELDLASEEDFRANVTRKGEKMFIGSLRAMATNSVKQGSIAWEDLFQDGKSFSFGPGILIVSSV